MKWFTSLIIIALFCGCLSYKPCTIVIYSSDEWGRPIDAEITTNNPVDIKPSITIPSEVVTKALDAYLQSQVGIKNYKGTKNE